MSKSGWNGESQRHSMAKKGIKTSYNKTAYDKKGYYNDEFPKLIKIMENNVIFNMNIGEWKKVGKYYIQYVNNKEYYEKYYDAIIKVKTFHVYVNGENKYHIVEFTDSSYIPYTWDIDGWKD